ncbi:alanine--glyoxylate aminotransferase-like [Oppia nitens]|uniref:alanine--glyoxylate aminotransferase-like n=1 Tax=Oppia nitens TaxID=1686743 RepID=UPI0023DAFE2C|nr:alanine--glyoxylate aminotransferase-like [Oppia nitens]
MTKLDSYVEPPEQLAKPLEIEGRLLMNAGPNNMDNRVIAAMTQPIVHIMDKQFFQVQQDICAGIRYVFQTRNHYSMAMTGSGSFAMEAGLCNLLEPGDTLLVAIHGYWGERVASMGRKRGYNVVELKTKRHGNDVFTVQQIEDAIKQCKPQLLYICHGDSTVCTLQPLEGIAQVCHDNGCLMMVDAILSLCCTPLNADQLDIDLVVGASQKSLAAPPGLALISLSDRAVRRLKNRTVDVDTFCLDFKLLARAWCLDGDNNYQFMYHYSPATVLLYALREALAMVADEGLDNVIHRHRDAHQYLQQYMTEELGLQLFVERPEYRLPGLLAVCVPEDVVSDKVVSYLNDKHRITITGGLGPTFGKVWRLGFLGSNANRTSVQKLCTALADALIVLRNKN